MPLRVLIAPSGYKANLYAKSVTAAIAPGVRRAFPNVIIDELPLADGSEGTAATMARFTQGQTIFARPRLDTLTIKVACAGARFLRGTAQFGLMQRQTEVRKTVALGNHNVSEAGTICFHEHLFVQKEILGMRSLFLVSLLSVATLAGCVGTSRSEMRANRENVREQRQDVRDAKQYGDRRDVREEREELREARQERREDRRNPD